MPLHRACAVALLLCSILFCPSRGAAQTSYSSRLLSAVRAASPPTIDGAINDAAWSAASRAEPFIDTERFAPAADQTTALLLFDEKAIYVAFRCVDARPAEVVARETVRDSQYGQGEGVGGGEDAVEFVLDPFLTRRYEDTCRFTVNPIGTRSARFGSGRARKAEWSGDWEAAAKRTPDGWTAEMRVPWALLSYPASKAPITMGLNFGRFQYRTRIRSQWSDLGREGLPERAGRWEGVRPPKAFRPSVSVLQYLLTETGDGNTGLRSGIDARYRIKPELTGVLSVNPDFATVEGAVESVMFTRGERYVQEKRPFFLEGGNVFSTDGFNIAGSWFHTMRIPEFDVGAKVYGRLNGSDTLGVLSTVSVGDRADVVAKYRHDLATSSYVSALVQHRDADRVGNTGAIGILEHRRGKFLFNGQLGATSGRGAGGRMAQAGLVYFDRRGIIALVGADVAPSFRLPHGYVPFTGLRGGVIVSEGGAEWRKGFWRNYHYNVVGQYMLHADGRPFQRGGSVMLGLTARSDWGVRLFADQSRFDSQKDALSGFWIGRNVSNRFNSMGMVLRTGTLGDRPATVVGPAVQVRIFRKLDIGLSGTFQFRDGTTQQQIGTVSYELSPTRSIGGRLVSTNGAVNGYLSYHNSGGKGLETYVLLGDPNALRFQSQVALKLVKPW